MISYRHVLDVMRIHQQRYDFVDVAYASDLNLVETYVLIEADIDPHITIRGLQPILMLDHSTISRAYYRLLEDGYMKSNPDPNNRRKRILEITEKGREFLALHDAENDKLVSQNFARLSSSEVAEFQRSQKLIADATGVPPIVLRKEEHHLMGEIRRITRGMGFIGPSLFGSGYSSTVWQLLAAIRDLAPNATLSSLTELFKMNPSTLSQQIIRFERDNWIQRVTTSSDLRVKSISLTEIGFAKLEEIYSFGEKLLAKAFRHQDPGLAENFVVLTMKYFGILGDNRLNLDSIPITCSQIRSEDERKSARAYLIMHLMRTGKFLDASEVLIGKKNDNFALHVGEKLKSVAELASSAQGWELLNCGWDDPSNENQLLLTFIRQITLTLTARAANAKVLIRKGVLPDAVIESVTQDAHLSKFVTLA